MNLENPARNPHSNLRLNWKRTNLINFQYSGASLPQLLYLHPHTEPLQTLKFTGKATRKLRDSLTMAHEACLSCCWSLLRLVTWVRVSCWELLKSAEESVESAMQEVRSSRWSLVLARRTIAWQCGQIKNSRRSLERLESRGSVGAEDFVCIGLCMEIALCISPYTCLCISMCIDAFVMILFV